MPSIETKVLYSRSAIGTQVLLTSGGKSLVADAGDGLLRDLTKIYFDFETLVGVLITHEHSDHTGGLFSLLHFMGHLPRKEPLYIVAPKPVLYLRRLLKPPLMYSRLPFRAEIDEVEEGMMVGLGPFMIEPFAIEHSDLPSLGYSVSDSSGYRVVISGDAVAGRGLRRRVLGADLAVLESTFEDGQEKYARAYGHMTVGQARSVGRLAKRVVLVHQMPQDYFERMTCSVIEGEEAPRGGRPSSSRKRPSPRRR
jgi:ribonuclease BN (tRNA processing enzyme)